MQLSEINNIVNGCLYGKDTAIDAVSINTRTLQSGDLFIAIKGENFDGNAFVDQAEKAQAGAAIVHTHVNTTLPQIVVHDTHLALAELAHAWRKKSQVKMVGITGSNGKTSTKEMTAAILGIKAPVLFTQGNLNNDIGVPLTLLKLQSQHQYAVIEMGANHQGEIKYTCACAQPDIAIITNVGPAHIEGFGDLNGVAEAKSEIISGLSAQGTAILNADDDYYPYWEAIAGSRQIISFGLTDNADIRASNIKTTVKNKQFVTLFELHMPEQSITIELALPGQHNVCNALAAAAAAYALNISAEQIKHGLESVQAVTGRMQALVGKQGNIVIDDTYNANPASLKAALDVLVDCPGEPWLVLGAFGEMGTESRQIHQQMGALIKQKGIKRLFATGNDAKYSVQQFGEGATYFESQEALIKSLNDQLSSEQTVLIKGSRAQHMETVAAAIVNNFRT